VAGPVSLPSTLVCARCATELSAFALACPACAALVHRQRLEELADRATRAATAKDIPTARALWQEARTLVPVESEQHAMIGARLDALPFDQPSSPQPTADTTHGSWWARAGGVAIVIGALLIGKLKFLLFGLTKLQTLLSMFGFIGVYWSIHGWPLAVGIAVSIYIHEMGHVAMLKRLGIQAGAPLFIPGVGALVMLKEHVTDPIVDARIGLAGPVWGLGAAVAALIAYGATAAPIWLAIAELTAFLNLFNLIPVWQLDGARGFHALSRPERLLVVGAVAVALWLTGVGVLWIVAVVAIYRAGWTEMGPGHQPTLATFIVLILGLSWIARAIG
jgi:Zn-dependent protease